MPCILACNEGKMHQAILNILANAIQAIPDKGKITIGTKKEKQKIIITITDTGSGISEENLPRITDLFFTTKDPGKGIGLGLSITYNIIQEHRGTLEFESQPGMDGLEFIRIAKREFPGISFFILTGYDVSKEITAAVKEGLIYKYFSKPFNIKEIKTSLYEALRLL